MGWLASVQTYVGCSSMHDLQRRLKCTVDLINVKPCLDRPQSEAESMGIGFLDLAVVPGMPFPEFPLQPVGQLHLFGSRLALQTLPNSGSFFILMFLTGTFCIGSVTWSGLEGWLVDNLPANLGARYALLPCLRCVQQFATFALQLARKTGIQLVTFAFTVGDGPELHQTKTIQFSFGSFHRPF